MNASEAAQVLTAAALVDKRTVGEADARMWAEILPGSIGPRVAIEAVKAYYAENRDMIMPADVVKYAATVRSRLSRALAKSASADDHSIAFRELPTAGHRVIYNREYAEAMTEGANADEAHDRAMRATGVAAEREVLELTPAPLPASYYTEY